MNTNELVVKKKKFLSGPYGIWTMTFAHAIPVQRSTNWANKPTVDIWKSYMCTAVKRRI